MERQATAVSPQPREGIPAYRPRWGFSKGFLTGVAIEVPVITLAVWVLAQIGVGDPDVSFMHVMRLTTVFAGIAAVLTAGGIGRLAAFASVDGGRKKAMLVAGRAHAAASAGLVLIAAIPHGHLPGKHAAQWLAYPAAGIVAGALCGMAIGLVCGGTAPVELADVWSLARKPTDALRSWLDPRELVKLGAAVRNRTTNLFEGIFEPAPPPPKPDAKPPATPAGEPKGPKAE